MSHSNNKNESQTAAVEAMSSYLSKKQTEIDSSELFYSLMHFRGTDGSKLDEDTARALYSMKADIEAARAVTFEDTFGSKFSKNKTRIMTRFSDIDKSNAMNMMADALMSNGLITEEQYSKLTDSKLTIGQFDEFLENNNILSKTNSSGLIDLIKSKALSAGTAYETAMESSLLGFRPDKKMSKELHRQIVDEHLEAFRTRSKAEAERERLSEIANELKEEKKKKEAAKSPAEAITNAPIEVAPEIPAADPAETTIPVDPADPIDPAASADPADPIDTDKEAETETLEDPLGGEDEITGDDLVPDKEGPIDGLTKEEADDIASADSIVDGDQTQGDDLEQDPVTDEMKDDAAENAEEALEQMDSAEFYLFEEASDSAEDANAPSVRYDKLSHTLFFATTNTVLAGATQTSVVRPDINLAKAFFKRS